MSGIVGQINTKNKKADIELLEKMSKLVNHRGLDGKYLFTRNNVGVINNRNKIFDLNESIEDSMVSDDGNICIAYDGEVYNYLDLKETLLKEGYKFKTDSDAEVILHLYKKYGIEFLEYIDGVYAIAILDFNESIVYLIRDTLGTKPLMYVKSSTDIFFASEAKALIKSGAQKSQLDPYGLKDYIHIQLYIGEKTLFKGVNYVEPGHYIKVGMENGHIDKIKYWDIPENEVKIGYEDAIDELEKLITESIRACCKVDGSISAYISGGLDSSLVASIASKHVNTKYQDKLYTYSSIYPDMDFKDEHEFSSLVASNIISEHNNITLSKEDMFNAHINELMYKIDMPEAGYAAPYMLMSRNTRKRSKVVLTGNGGDEFYGGYPKYVAALLARSLNKGYNSEEFGFDLNNLKYLNGFENQAKNIIQKSLFNDETELLKSLFYRSEFLWNYIDESIKKETKDYNVAEQIYNVYKHRNTGYLKKLMYLDQKILLTGLLHIEDRTCMIENLVSRSPLVSKNLINFVSSIPEEYILRDGLKGLIREVAKRHIPYKVATNTHKSGMIYPVPEFLSKHMKNQISNDVNFLDKIGLFNSPINKISNAQNEQIYSRTTWGLWCLSTWMRSFIS